MEADTLDTADRTALAALPIIILVGVGMAWAGSQGGVSVHGTPLFALLVGVAFLMQWLAFVPAYLRQTERFFDITGSATYLTLMIGALVLNPAVTGRSILLLALVAAWAMRLGTFLFRRIHRAGKDKRFDAIKLSFPRFLMTWMLQGLWVTITLAPALAATTTLTVRSLGVVAAVGAVVWACGFTVEVVADTQKSRFRDDPTNRGRFMRTGLWAWSRHPNYFGEIVLWIGIALVALPVLRGWQLVTLVSPLFVTLLLTRVSGVPMLEQRADEQWGGQPDYEAYKARTPVLIPLRLGRPRTDA